MRSAGMRLPLFFLLMALLTACGQRHGFAPVEELKWHARNPYQSTHMVRRGETLYAIAFRYDKDYRQLARYNRIPAPYSLRIGQVLRLQYGKQYYSPSYKTVKNGRFGLSQSHSFAKHTVRSFPQSRPLASRASWLWPAQGKVVANFFPEKGKKGIDIAGKKGEVVRAALGGIVAYSGSGLSGYGNLIIIKHEGQFLSAYGNNAKNRVKEGQKVKAGQIIAEMGIVDRKFWGVHFEIRQAGQPVNPVHYLQ